MKARIFEVASDKIIMADEPVPVRKGDVVVFAVVESWEDAARILMQTKRAGDGQQD